MRNVSDFESEWPGGYFEGDPAQPFSSSNYLSLGYVSVLYATYLVCLKPHVGPETTVLEIGPGRGAWTKAILDLGPKKIWALDAASAEHSGFTAYVGASDRVEHRQVSDESLREVPDDSVDLFFSFGVFCHLPEEIVGNYLTSLYAKMTAGSNGYFLVADFAQFEAANASPDALDHLFALKRYTPHRATHTLMKRMFPSKMRDPLRSDPEASASHWYDIGKDAAAGMAEAAGFDVVSRDVQTSPRDPILHIRKP